MSGVRTAFQKRTPALKTAGIALACATAAYLAGAWASDSGTVQQDMAAGALPSAHQNSKVDTAALDAYLKKAFTDAARMPIDKLGNGNTVYLVAPDKTTLMTYVVTFDAAGEIVEYKPYLATNGLALEPWAPQQQAPSEISEHPVLSRLAQEYELAKLEITGPLQVWQVAQHGKAVGLAYTDPEASDYVIMHSFSAPHLSPQVMGGALQSQEKYEVKWMSSEIPGVVLKDKATGELYTAYAFPKATGMLISGQLVDANMTLLTARHLAQSGMLDALPAVQGTIHNPPRNDGPAIAAELPISEKWLENPDDAASQVGSSAIEQMSKPNLDVAVWDKLGKAITIRMGNPAKSPVKAVLSTACVHCAKMMLQLLPFIQNGDVYLEAVLIGPQADLVYAAPNAVEALYKLYFDRVGGKSFRPDWTTTEFSRSAAGQAEALVNWIAQISGQESFGTPMIMYRDRTSGDLVRMEGLPEDLGARLGLFAREER